MGQTWFDGLAVDAGQFFCLLLDGGQNVAAGHAHDCQNGTIKDQQHNRGGHTLSTLHMSVQQGHRRFQQGCNSHGCHEGNQYGQELL